MDLEVRCRFSTPHCDTKTLDGCYTLHKCTSATDMLRLQHYRRSFSSSASRICGRILPGENATLLLRLALLFESPSQIRVKCSGLVAHTESLSFADLRCANMFTPLDTYQALLSRLMSTALLGMKTSQHSLEFKLYKGFSRRIATYSLYILTLPAAHQSLR